MFSYKKFFIPISNTKITLKEALFEMHKISSDPSDVPWIVRLVENPKLDIPGIRVFNGAVDLFSHDCIHLILGRGMMPKDEAFVIGFTMGSTKKIFKFEKFLYHFVTEYLYPKPFNFTNQEHMVFDIAASIADVSSCKPLDKVDFTSMLEWSLEKIRDEIGIKKEYLINSYRLEKTMFPKELESARLLD